MTSNSDLSITEENFGSPEELIDLIENYDLKFRFKPTNLAAKAGSISLGLFEFPASQLEK